MVSSTWKKRFIKQGISWKFIKLQVTSYKVTSYKVTSL